MCELHHNRGLRKQPNEQRFVTPGAGAMGRLLVVVYTWHGENIRVISARPAEAPERAQCEGER
ncbi:MAG: BrnT family toxin [Acidobacteria bacterium]|nr:BrnT family toxin [Acidobacteriota bacterium]